MKKLRPAIHVFKIKISQKTDVQIQISVNDLTLSLIIGKFKLILIKKTKREVLNVNLLYGMHL